MSDFGSPVLTKKDYLNMIARRLESQDLEIEVLEHVFAYVDGFVRENSKRPQVQLRLVAV